MFYPQIGGNDQLGNITAGTDFIEKCAKERAFGMYTHFYVQYKENTEYINGIAWSLLDMLSYHIKLNEHTIKTFEL